MHYRRWLRLGELGEVDTLRHPQFGPCAVDGCDRDAVQRGWCDLHWKRWRRYGDPTAIKKVQNWHGALCAVDDCDRVVEGHGYCDLHWSRWRKYGDPGPPDLIRPQSWDGRICSVDDCFRPVKALGYCEVHLGRWRRHGDPGVTEFRGVVSRTWLKGHPQRAAEPAYIYLMTFDDLDSTPFLKVGIGRANIGYNRVRHHERNGGRLLDLEHDTLERCYYAEQAIIEHVAPYKYDPATLPSGGITECFAATVDVRLAEWLERRGPRPRRGDGTRPGAAGGRPYGNTAPSTK